MWWSLTSWCCDNRGRRQEAAALYWYSVHLNPTTLSDIPVTGVTAVSAVLCRRTWPASWHPTPPKPRSTMMRVVKLVCADSLSVATTITKQKPRTRCKLAASLRHLFFWDKLDSFRISDYNKQQKRHIAQRETASQSHLDSWYSPRDERMKNSREQKKVLVEDAFFQQNEHVPPQSKPQSRCGWQELEPT